MILDPTGWDVSREFMEQNVAEFADLVGADKMNRWLHRTGEYAMTLLHTPPVPGQSAIDIGGACSFVGLYLRSKGVETSIVDPGVTNPGLFSEWLDDMRHFDPDRQVKIQVQNAATLPFFDDTIDSVFTFSALEHFAGEDDIACVKEVHRVLKTGGVFTGTVDYNVISERPHPVAPAYRAYTPESFFRRVVSPVPWHIPGKIHFSEPVLEDGKTKYIAAPLFFKLRK